MGVGKNMVEMRTRESAGELARGDKLVAELSLKNGESTEQPDPSFVFSTQGTSHGQKIIYSWMLPQQSPLDPILYPFLRPSLPPSYRDQDLEMYYAEADTPARVRTMNLNEDLGQVRRVTAEATILVVQ